MKMHATDDHAASGSDLPLIVGANAFVLILIGICHAVYAILY